jgi:hypothetical protein
LIVELNVKVDAPLTDGLLHHGRDERDGARQRRLLLVFDVVPYVFCFFKMRHSTLVSPQLVGKVE